MKLKIDEIKKDFKLLFENEGIQSILLYGSYVNGKPHLKSDVDICVVTPNCKTIKQKSEMLGYIWGNVNAEKYDIRLFEELPLYIKISVIKNYKIIYTKDLAELQYYFYVYRKLWEGQSVNWIEKKI